MSAEVLREAAALMRARAEGASGSPWSPILIEDEDGSADSYVISLAGLTSNWEDVGESMVGQDAEHIASWHPAVALAVADWLDSTSSFVEMYGEGGAADRGYSLLRSLAVARAYLGEAS